mgnify:CR=1 FL=1
MQNWWYIENILYKIIKYIEVEKDCMAVKWVKMAKWYVLWGVVLGGSRDLTLTQKVCKRWFLLTSSDIVHTKQWENVHKSFSVYNYRWKIIKFNRIIIK